jgi:hypothetical protein
MVATAEASGRPRTTIVHRTRRAMLAALAGLVAVPATGATASAASPSPQIVVSVQQQSGAPSAYFAFGATPGRTTQAGDLVVRNNGRTSVRVRLDAVDGGTANTLGSVYGAAGSAVHGATRWLLLGTRNLTVSRHSTRRVPVAVTVPAGSAPGDYLSGISVWAQNQTPTLSSAGHVAIASWYRYAVGVEPRLPGARRPHLAFSGAGVVRQPASVVFQLFAHNDGNVILKDVTGHAIVTRSGRIVAQVPFGPGTFVTHSDIALPVRALGEQPSAGTAYHVQAELVYRGGVARLDTDVTFSSAAAKVQQQYVNSPGSSLFAGVPRWLALLLGALAAVPVVLLGVLVVALAKRRRALRSGAAIRACVQRELSGDGQPPSIICVGGAGRSARARRSLARGLRPQLRKRDAIGDLGDDRILIVLPHASAEYAESVAAALAGVGPFITLAAARAEPGDDAHRLIERGRQTLAASAAPPPIPTPA